MPGSRPRAAVFFWREEYLERIRRREAENRANQLAYFDALTGLPNRANFTRTASNFINEDSDPVLFMIDLDDFKLINDRHGHGVGDQTLVRVVEGLETCMRQGDLLARWGGDEFIVVLPKSPLEAAKALAERIRQRIAQLPAVGDFNVTLSLGVVERRTGEPPTALMARADQALYRSKAAGKDIVSE